MYEGVNETLLFICVMCQVYKAGVHPRYPDGGKMSQYLDSLEVGDTVDIRGPDGKVSYLGKGQFIVVHFCRCRDLISPSTGDFEIKLSKNESKVKHVTEVGLIAGGTGGCGLTFMYLLLPYSLIFMCRNHSNATDH